MSLIAHASSASSSSSSIHIHPQSRDDMWQMNLISIDQMESVCYPAREGEPNCSYYIRTGFCRFGDTCRFNHPPDRNLSVVTARMKGEYPERIGQPECQYYLKTGTCKFGATCKFHHPRDQAGAAGGAILNVMGYPLRPNEVECAFYMRNGHCKFGSTCKFHHPQPSNMMVSVHGSGLYPPIHSGSSEQSAQRVSFITGPQWQSPSSCGQLIMPQGVLPVPWNTQGEVGSVSPSENQQQQTAGNSQNTGTSFQVGSAHVGFQFGSNSLPVGNYAFERGSVFPERPGQPECQFYMKTGDCKFGATCKFHHPREGLIPVLNCVLSPIGLPLRPGEPVCVFYLEYGVCKFGPSCKFDHPMRAAAAFSSTDGTTFMKASSSGTVALSLPTNGIVVEASDSTKGRLLSLTEARQKPSEDNLNTEERRLIEVELPSTVGPANQPVSDTQR